jgi:Protein of unknown function (DUF3455)
MKRVCILSLLLVLPACSGDDSNANGGEGMDSSTPDTSTPSPTPEAGTKDTGSPDTGMTDAGKSDADAEAVQENPDGAADADAADMDLDAGDGSCPAAWFEAPEVDPSIALPDGGGGVLIHAGGDGTQNYVCEALANDAGYAWTLVTPEAKLSDCHGAVIGHHFASEAGAGFPEWQSTDGTYVVGIKHVPTFTPDGGSGSIPWLLLTGVGAGGTGTLSKTDYIQRLNTDGGNAPATGCDGTKVGAAVNVPYTAEYYFYGP